MGRPYFTERNGPVTPLGSNTPWKDVSKMGTYTLLSLVWSAVCVKTQDDTGIYNSCWYLRFMLVFTKHAGIYTSCWYRKYQHEV